MKIYNFFPKFFKPQYNRYESDCGGIVKDIGFMIHFLCFRIDCVKWR